MKASMAQASALSLEELTQTSAADSLRTISEYYDRTAAGHDAIYEIPENRRALALLMYQTLQLFSGRKVVDLGCGTGYWTRQVASVAKSVTGIELSGEMVRRARQRFYPRPVKIEQADVLSPSGLREQFEGAYMSFFFRHIPRESIRGFFDSLHTRLESGSPVVILENYSVPQSKDDQFAQLKTQEEEFRVLSNSFLPEELMSILDGKADDIAIIRQGKFLFFKYTLKETKPRARKGGPV